MLDEILISKLKDKKIENVCGIYVILNVVTNKVYIGSSVALRDRKNRHFNDLRNSRHCNDVLQNSWDKHGEDNFVFMTIEICEKDVVRDREQFYLDYYKPYIKGNGYNLSSTLSGMDKSISSQMVELCKKGHKLTIINNKRNCEICLLASINKRRKTHCSVGHALEGDNIIYEDGIITKRIRCKTCRNKQKKDKYTKKNIPLSNFCSKGHEYTEENTIIYFKKHLKCRKCKICRDEYSKKYKPAKRKTAKNKIDEEKNITIRTVCKKGHALTEKCLIKKSCCECIRIASRKHMRKIRLKKGNKV